MAHPLALSDSQLRLVTSYAARLPVHWRSRFLAGLADELVALDSFNDDDVLKAAVGVLQRMLPAPGDAA